MNAPHASKGNPWMSHNKKKCETYGLVFTKFHQSNYWEINKFCQLGCFKVNNGYEGDDCCENQTPVQCKISTNEETICTKGNNKQCSSITLIIIKCKFRSTWVIGNFRQQSCFEEVNGYDKNICCESAKKLTEKPSNNPSYFPSNKPHPLLG